MSAKMQPLTERQKQVLDFIIDYKDEHGFSPSYPDICDAFGWASRKSASDHIAILQKKGYIKKPFGKSRAITIIRPKLETVVIAGRRIDVGFMDGAKRITHVG